MKYYLLFSLFTTSSVSLQFSRSQITRMNIDNTPSTIIKQLGTTGEPIGSSWSYYDLSKHIQDNDIDGVSIVTKNDHVSGLFAIVNSHDVGNILAANVLPIQIIYPYGLSTGPSNLQQILWTNSPQCRSME